MFGCVSVHVAVSLITTGILVGETIEDAIIRSTNSNQRLRLANKNFVWILVSLPLLKKDPSTSSLLL